MPSELAIRALCESKLKAELIAIAEEEGVSVIGLDSKRQIAVEIVEAREAVEKLMAEATDMKKAELETDVAEEPVKHEADSTIVTIEGPDYSPAEVDALINAIDEQLTKGVKIRAIEPVEEPAVQPEVADAREAVKAASAAFLAAGAKPDGPERKARRDAKAKLYALLA